MGGVGGPSRDGTIKWNCFEAVDENCILLAYISLTSCKMMLCAKASFLVVSILIVVGGPNSTCILDD